MESTLHGEFADAAESYAHTGRATLNGKQFEERRQQQCPTIFALPSLAAQPFWPASTPGCVVDADVVRAISKEYHDHRDMLRQERVEAEVSRGEWDVNYLMEEGRWCHSSGSRLVSEYFPVTASVLSSFPVFETGLGYVYFSRLRANTEIRPHCGPTNCKLRVQIVLYPNMEGLEDNGEGEGQGDVDVDGGVGMGVLAVADQQRGYRSGETVAFDDSFVHSVRTGGQERVVLLIDVWHPSLLSEANQDIREGIAGVFPIQQDPEAVEMEHRTSNLTGSHEMSAVAAVVTTEAIWATVTTAVTAVAVTEDDVSEMHMLVPHAAVTEMDTVAGTTSEMSTLERDTMSLITTAVPAAEVVETTTLTAAPVTENRSDNLATTVLKIANEALDEQQRRLQLLQNCNLDPRAVVRAEDVFVSVPEARDGFSHHPQSTLYAKHKILSEPNSYNYLFKMLLVGDAGAGKSSFLLRLSEDTFTMNYIATIGVDFKIITRGFCDPVCPASVKGPPVTVKMQLWDTAGPERFRTITSSYYRGAMGIFLMFDITDRQSFVNVRTWIDQIQTFGMPDVAILMVGMKNDRSYQEEDDTGKTGKHGAVGGKEPAIAVAVPTDVVDRQVGYGIIQAYDRYREVPYEEALALAEEFGIPYMECSAMTGENTQNALATLVHHIFRKRGDTEFASATDRSAPATTAASNSNKRCVIS